MSASGHDQPLQTTIVIQVLLAAWLIVSPWLLGTTSRSFTVPSWDFTLNTVAIGSLLLGLAAMRIQLDGTIVSSSLSAVLGAWLIVSPQMFGYDAEDLQTRNCVVVGTVICAVAMFNLLSRIVSGGRQPSSRDAARRAQDPDSRPEHLPE